MVGVLRSNSEFRMSARALVQTSELSSRRQLRKPADAAGTPNSEGAAATTDCCGLLATANFSSNLPVVVVSLPLGVSYVGWCFQ